MDWQSLCVARRKKQFDSIPSEWLIDPPPAQRLNVIDVPQECGLLTTRELEITETVDVELLLRKLSSAEWSSVEVTTAFYKRAIIAQQLVSAPLSCIHWIHNDFVLVDELSHGDFRISRFGASQRAR
jgi:amidase